MIRCNYIAMLDYDVTPKLTANCDRSLSSTAQSLPQPLRAIVLFFSKNDRETLSSHKRCSARCSPIQKNISRILKMDSVCPFICF